MLWALVVVMLHPQNGLPEATSQTILFQNREDCIASASLVLNDLAFGEQAIQPVREATLRGEIRVQCLEAVLSGGVAG